MKLIMLAGALAGFAIGTGVGWFRGCTPADLFWHGCLAMYAGGMMARWYGRQWLKSFREACEHRAAAALAAAEAAEAAEQASRPTNPARS
jgi:hypothetical protein